MKTIILYFLLLFGLFSCKKDQPEVTVLPENNDPVFYVSGTIDGLPFFQQAGENNAFVTNGVMSRNGMDYTFGEFKYQNDVLRLGIFDGNEELPNLSSMIVQGDSLFLTGKIIESLASFDQDLCSNYSKITQIKWYKDGQLIGLNQFQLSDPGKYNICGEFTFVNGSTRTVCNSLLIGFYQEMQLRMNHFMLGSGKTRLWISGTDSLNVKSISWKRDGELVSNNLAPILDIPQIQSVITAEITSKNDKKYTRNIIVDGSNSGLYTEDFNLFVKPSVVQWDYAVGIDIKKNNTWYSTFNTQNYKSKMVVDQISLYELNSKGEKVYKIEGHIDAKLSAENQGESIYLKLKFVYPIILN
ncbi:MAG: hypothetical protein KJ941_13140 [Bacteroidetes bacterium]|nr:hypothetical protein [Bacteroidota bacterium]